MAGRLSRFLNLEKPRAETGEEPPVPLAKPRFSGEPEPPPVDFRAARDAELRSGIEIDTGSSGEQPFLRCPYCEADNTKYAAKCINCQRSLQTDEVHAWNQKLWAARKAAAAAAPVQEQPADLQRQPVEAQRQLGEAIAREVAARENARLGWETYDPTPIGVRLLRWLPTTRLRVIVGVALAALGLAGLAVGVKGHLQHRPFGFVVAIVLFALFTPTSPRRWRRGWFSGWWW